MLGLTSFLSRSRGYTLRQQNKNSVRTLRIETPLWQMLYTQASLVLGSDKG